MSALGIIPTYIKDDNTLAVTIKTLETLRQVEPDLSVLVVDDGSPFEEGLPALEQACGRLGIDLEAKEVNSGFSSTVNIGLTEALENGRDAILINADIEFVVPFVDTFTQTLDSQERPAALVGALLLYPKSHLIQHAGIYFSLYERAFDHKYKFAPGGLPEAHIPVVCPCTGALLFHRHSTLETVGIYDDEQFRLGWEDVDYNLRVFEAGLECVYQPSVVAIHHESIFRSEQNEKMNDWHQQSLTALHTKHAQTALGRYVPVLM